MFFPGKNKGLIKDKDHRSWIKTNNPKRVILLNYIVPKLIFLFQ